MSSRSKIALTVLAAVHFGLPSLLASAEFRNDQYSLQADGEQLALVDPDGGRIELPTDALISDQQREDAEQTYISAFEFDTEVTSFTIGAGRTGIHLSSYEISRGGSAAAAGGRDVFLMIDAEAGTMIGRSLNLGFAKYRSRGTGCFQADYHRFLIGDVNRDGLTDLGSVKQELKCVDRASDDTRALPPWVYAETPTRWYVVDGNGWVEDESLAGRLPGGYEELPLIGLRKTPVDFVLEQIRSMH